MAERILEIARKNKEYPLAEQGFADHPPSNNSTASVGGRGVGHLCSYIYIFKSYKPVFNLLASFNALFAGHGF